MSKKKSRKKHQFKYATPTTGTQSSPVSPEIAGSVASPKNSITGSTNTSTPGDTLTDLPYILSDVRKTTYLAIGFVAAQLVLWYLFNHTGLGASIYHLVKL